MFGLHKHWKHPQVSTEISIIRLILAFGLAAIDTIWAIYMYSFGLTESTIGFISASFIIITLILSFYSTIILEKFNTLKLIIFSLIVYTFSYLVLGYFKNLYVFLGITAILTVVSIFRRKGLGILFRDQSTDINKDISILYTLLNISWLIGPLLAGLIVAQYGDSAIFLFASGCFLLSTIIFINLDLKIEKKQRDGIDTNIIKNIKDFIKKPQLKISYIVGSGIEIWWALIYIYIPLFIIKNGLGEEIVGFFLSAAMLPLVLFEYKAGMLSKKIGFKPLLTFGFLLLGIAGLCAFLYSNIYFVLILFIIASIPMAAVEPLQESFFFKQVTSNQEEKFYPIFSTSANIGGFIGKISIASILLFLPDNFAYLTISIFMFIAATICIKIKD